MNHRLARMRAFTSLSLIASMSLVLACGDDGTGSGSSGEGTSTETSATDSATESATATESDSAEAGTDSATTETATETETETDSGDGDGDSGDGDGDSGDGDGDSGDGDGDSGDGDGDSGDGDGDSGDGDGDSGSGDGDGDTGDGDGDTTDTDMPCQESVGEVAPIPPSVMFLLDRSGSMMGDDFDQDDPLKTRWQALYEAVELIVTGNDAQIAFGAKTFSTQGQGSCGVSNLPDVDIELNNANNILAGIPGPLEVVNGGTPTNLALEKTMTIMEFFDAQDSDKFIFLITDGRIGCIDDTPEADQQALDDAVAVLEDGLMNHDITTYVVGIAPSNNGPILGQLEGMAIAGGAPKPGLEAFYRADDAEQLAEALDAVLQDSYGKSCLLNLDEPPFFPEFTKVLVGQNLYELVDNCDNEDGFVYTNDEFTQIQLCGLACEDLGNLGIDESAEVQYFCDPG